MSDVFKYLVVYEHSSTVWISFKSLLASNGVHYHEHPRLPGCEEDGGVAIWTGVEARGDLAAIGGLTNIFPRDAGNSTINKGHIIHETIRESTYTCA